MPLGSQTPRQDHPRVCGEKAGMGVQHHKRRGSPPRVRGKGTRTHACTRVYRITPACAGKSEAKEFACKDGRDHPRVCGEKHFPHGISITLRGSPPRVRGKESPSDKFKFDCRITPACAGKRLKRSHSIGHFSCILCLFHSVLHRASVSGGSRAGPCAPPCLPAQNAVPV